MTLRCTLEIVPFGKEEEKYTIETLNISNLGTTDLVEYDYGVEHNKYKTEKYDVVVQHKRDDGPLVLVEKVLRRLLKKNF